MAYTGTGTQADPYVVTTFADFLACVAQEGVYVEVGADLDAAAEGFGYISPIDVKAVEVYGTAGDTLRKISNVTVEGSYIFTSSYNPAQLISRLHLENWTWKAVTPAVMFNKANNTSVDVQHCKMSVSAAADNASSSVKLKKYCRTADSAFVIQMHNCGNFAPCTGVTSNEGFRNTTISIDGSGTTTWAAETSASNRWQSCTNTGIVLKNMEITGAPGFNSGDGFSYMVFEDCTLTGTSSIYAVKESNLICFAGTTSDESAKVNYGTVVTQSQLKDKAYLQSIGWLP